MHYKKLKSGREVATHNASGFWLKTFRAFDGVVLKADRVFVAACQHVEEFGKTSRNSVARDLAILAGLSGEELAEFLGDEAFEIFVMDGKLRAKIKKIEESVVLPEKQKNGKRGRA